MAKRKGDGPRCQATTVAGRPCAAPVVNPVTGYCPAHGAGGRERMRDRGRKGAEATRAKWRGKGLRDEELPELCTPQDAEAWLEMLGRAVATGRLGHHEGRTVVSAVQQWLRAHEAGAVSERVERLRRQLDELRTDKLKVVR